MMKLLRDTFAGGTHSCASVSQRPRRIPAAEDCRCAATWRWPVVAVLLGRPPKHWVM